MAASKKSTVLGLCLWEGTDKPRRVDFVADNEAIESQLGGHIQNDNLHLNDTRRKRLDTPTEVRTYTGTGAASRTILFGFSPSAVIVFAVDKPFSQAMTGCTKRTRCWRSDKALYHFPRGKYHIEQRKIYH